MQALLRLRLPRGQGRPSLAQGAARPPGSTRREPTSRISGRSAGRAARSDCTSPKRARPRELGLALSQRGAEHDQVVAAATRRCGGSRSPSLGLVGGQALDGHAAALAQAMRVDQHRYAEPPRRGRAAAACLPADRRRAAPSGCRGWRAASVSAISVARRASALPPVGTRMSSGASATSRIRLPFSRWRSARRTWRQSAASAPRSAVPSSEIGWSMPTKAMSVALGRFLLDARPRPGHCAPAPAAREPACAAAGAPCRRLGHVLQRGVGRRPSAGRDLGLVVVLSGRLEHRCQHAAGGPRTGRPASRPAGRWRCRRRRPARRSILGTLSLCSASSLSRRLQFLVAAAAPAPSSSAGWAA